MEYPFKNPDKQIAKYIHYPDCWDTVAYPTLASALWEMSHHEELGECSQCHKMQGIKQ